MDVKIYAVAVAYQTISEVRLSGVETHLNLMYCKAIDEKDAKGIIYDEIIKAVPQPMNICLVAKPIPTEWKKI